MTTPDVAIHLSFNGDCAEAFRTYARIFGAEIRALMPYEGTPVADEVSPDQRQRILHAAMAVGGVGIMGADATDGHPYRATNGFAMSLTFETDEEARAIFAALSEGGSVAMPYGPTFWTRGFGMATDRFGVPWMIGCAH